MIEIPNFKTLHITHIVCDYNGTIAKDGVVLPEIKKLFEELSKVYTLHVITADTFGSVHSQLQKYNTEIKVLSSDNHTKEKAQYIKSLNADSCVALGNGNNDKEMLLEAAIGISILGDEGCAKDALINSDLSCKSISEALNLLLHTKRLVATLRR
ncbi:haloacid dehalogenase [Sulfurimonas aquatica]|uniref:Haloacid dehalogenase n=1 Tax=Sulfurimonas aquatica TaxID=2672570 RepID=A0A975GCT0_9BACT|nr:haloacid dehalogenase [Sulfurimonas aquatica]QSZ41945.1 haloacid dehalogenase [Sulfurimonas aquatica]